MTEEPAGPDRDHCGAVCISHAACGDDQTDNFGMNLYLESRRSFGNGHVFALYALACL